MSYKERARYADFWRSVGNYVKVPHRKNKDLTWL